MLHATIAIGLVTPTEKILRWQTYNSKWASKS